MTHSRSPDVSDILRPSIRSTEPIPETLSSRGLPLTVRQQHDLAEHSAFAQHFVRAARLLERQPLRDQGLDLALVEQIQQRYKSWWNHAGLIRINHWMLYGTMLFRPGLNQLRMMNQPNSADSRME